jgi:hypothetical protein
MEIELVSKNVLLLKKIGQFIEYQKRRHCQQTLVVLSFVCTGRIGRAGLDLASHGVVQSNLVWRGPLPYFICKFKMTSHI